MKFLIFLFLLLATAFLPTVLAEPHKLWEEVQIGLSISENGTIAGVSANITVRDPDNIILIPAWPMSNTIGTTDWNFTLPASNISKLGTYSFTVCAYSSSENKCFPFTFEVTPSGKEQTSIWENSVLIVFLALGILFIFIGAYQSNAWFGFIGSIMFLLGGIYTMIYGFNNQQDLYSQGIAITFLGAGIIFMFISAYEFIWGGEEE